MSFYNTLALNDAELKQALDRARNQEDRILAIFRRDPRSSWTPAEIHSRFFPEYPLTSVRRAMTDLTSAGLLEKTCEKRRGLYGLDNYTWRLAVKRPLTLF